MHKVTCITMIPPLTPLVTRMRKLRGITQNRDLVVDVMVWDKGEVRLRSASFQTHVPCQDSSVSNFFNSGL